MTPISFDLKLIWLIVVGKVSGDVPGRILCTEDVTHVAWHAGKYFRNIRFFGCPIEELIFKLKSKGLSYGKTN